MAKSHILKPLATAVIAFMSGSGLYAADYTLPFELTASQKILEDECVVLNSNNDASTWTYAYPPGAFKYTYNVTYKANDWLILPVVDFGDCTEVTITFDVQTGGGYEAFDLFLGKEQTAEAMTVPVLSRTKYTHDNTFETLSASVKVPQGDGANKWCLGFHALSDPDEYWIYINNIRIEKASGTVAVAPALPVITASSMDYLRYNATVQLPSLDTDGGEIQGEMSLNVYVDNYLTQTYTEINPGGVQAVALTLEEGEHTIGYQAVLNGVFGNLATEKVTAARKVITPASPVVTRSTTDGMTYRATVVMPSNDTAGEPIESPMSLTIAENGTTLRTLSNLYAGEQTEVELTLTVGSHTLEFTAVLDDQSSRPTEDTAVIEEPTYQLPFTFAPDLTTMTECIVIDANGDASGNDGRWAISDGAFCYTYNSYNDADDWVILPAVEFGKASKVKISVSAKTGAYPEGFEIWIGNERTISGMTTKVAERTNFVSKDTYQTIEATIDVPASADNKWAVGLHAISEADQFTLYIKDICIEEVVADNKVPQAPAFVSSQLEGSEYSATIRMPETTVTGDQIGSSITLQVLVDSETAMTKTGLNAGEETEIELTLTNGTHTVETIAVLDGVESNPASEKVTVKEPAGVTGSLPYTFTVNQDSFDQCLVFDLNNDGEASSDYKNGMWSYALLSGGGALKYTYSMQHQADDWIILPMVDFGDSKAVTVSFAVMTEYDSEDFEVYLGREREVEAMTLPVAEYRGYVHQNSFETISKTVTLPDALTRSDNNEWCVGIHVSSPANHYLLYINNIEISDATPLAITATEADDADNCEYYNLQGIRIASPTAGMPVIVRKGNQTYKTILR